eukprot:m.294975 g.294975  ORF g.294975 m.294975 type:complete len:614 (+) comp16392_c0_seq3:1-1842(+)
MRDSWLLFSRKKKRKGDISQQDFKVDESYEENRKVQGLIISLLLDDEVQTSLKKKWNKIKHLQFSSWEHLYGFLKEQGKDSGKKRNREDSPSPERGSHPSGGSTKKRKVKEAEKAEMEIAAKKDTAKQCATDFVKSILGAEELVISANDEPTGMTLWENIKDIWSGELYKVIIRSITREFWEQCILQTQHHRVCVVGTPGIGKSTSIPVLIRMLLEKRKSVVYWRRTLNEDNFKFKFVPKVDDEGNLYAKVQVYPETKPDNLIKSLKSTDTYYVIDPEKTKDSSEPPDDIKAKVIIVSSPDSRHWGGDEFGKVRPGAVGGIFLYYPIWTFEEMKIACPILNDNLGEKKFIKYIRLYGCVPRDVFNPKNAALKQKKALAALKEFHAKQIIAGEVVDVDSQGVNAPKSAIVVFKSTSPFRANKYEVVLASDAVAEFLQKEYLKLLWFTIPDAPTSRAAGDAFEVYVRNLWVSEKELSLDARNAVKKIRNQKATFKAVTLPNCTKKRCVLDIYGSVVKCKENILFHSVSEQEPLIDFIYKSGNNYYAMQVTISQSHDAAPGKIRGMMDKLKIKDGEQIFLYYLVPESNFKEFVTVPVEPKVNGVSVQIVGIPNPSK